MSDDSIREDLATDPELRRWLGELDDAGVVGLGATPEGHSGPYQPTQEELDEGFRRAIEDRAQLAKLRADLTSEELQADEPDVG